MAGRPDPPIGLTGAVCCRRGRPVDNEDNFYLNGRHRTLEQGGLSLAERVSAGRPGIFAVVDGMGGASYGEVASLLTVTRLAEADSALPPGGRAAAVDFLRETGRALRREARRRRASLGAAAVLAVVQGAELDLCNVGDSRGYLFSDGRLVQLTRDHTAAQSARALGLPIGDGEELRHQLTQYLGMDEEEFELDPFYRRVGFPQGGVLLLCTDGLTDALTEGDIADALSSGGGLVERAERLVERAMDAGSRDNVTALLVKRD